ncbi:MAG: hypothetical protein GWP91_02910 [Rhodobacterales bacterium]|nr:hypothetical protein [Rhodobacterales bacterium]
MTRMYHDIAATCAQQRAESAPSDRRRIPTVSRYSVREITVVVVGVAVVVGGNEPHTDVSDDE